jgi:hypothetical protein
MVRAGRRLERSMIRCGCRSFWSNSIRPDQGLDRACGNPPLVFATAASIQFLACACLLIGRR